MSIHVPEFKAIDTSGIADIPQLFQAARKTQADIEDKKATRANADRKLSADLARQQWEDQRAVDNEQHQRDVATSSQLLPGSDVMRAAQMSAGLGSQVGKPYGISFDETKTKQLPPDTSTSPQEAAQFLQSGGVPKAPGEPDPLLEPHAEPLQGPTPAGPSLGEHPDAPPAPGLNVDETTAAKEAAIPETRHMYATVRGSRTEVPAEGKSGYFAEPEYNAMFDKLVAQGLDDKAALTQVQSTRRTDLGEGGKASRAAATRAHQDQVNHDYRLTADEQKGLHSEPLDNAEREKLAYIHAMNGAGGGFNPKVEAGNTSDMNSLNARATQLRTSSAWAKLMDTQQQYDAMAEDVASGATPMQGKEAQVLAALLIRKRVSDAEMRHIYDNTGGAADAFARFAHNNIAGDLTPEQLRQLQASTAVLINGHKRMVARASEAAKYAFKDPAFAMMPDQAQHMYGMFMQEAGQPVDNLFDTEGGITLGTGKRPMIHPRAAGPAAAPRAPAPPPSVDPMRAKAERALADPAAPPEAKAAAHKYLGH